LYKLLIDVDEMEMDNLSENSMVKLVVKSNEPKEQSKETRVLLVFPQVIVEILAQSSSDFPSCQQLLPFMARYYKAVENRLLRNSGGIHEEVIIQALLSHYFSALNSTVKPTFGAIFPFFKCSFLESISIQLNADPMLWTNLLPKIVVQKNQNIEPEQLFEIMSTNYYSFESTAVPNISSEDTFKLRDNMQQDRIYIASPFSHSADLYHNVSNDVLLGIQIKGGESVISVGDIADEYCKANIAPSAIKKFVFVMVCFSDVQKTTAQIIAENETYTKRITHNNEEVAILFEAGCCFLYQRKNKVYTICVQKNTQVIVLDKVKILVPEYVLAVIHTKNVLTPDISTA